MPSSSAASRARAASGWHATPSSAIAKAASSRARPRRAPPSALVWANGGAPAPGDFRALVANGVRAPDPMLFVGDDWVVRRLGPRCERIALTDIDDLDGVREIMRAMGAETANIHRASQGRHPRRAA